MSKIWKKKVSVSAKKISAPILIPILSADTVTDTEFGSHTILWSQKIIKISFRCHADYIL
jgi:hypothetical protein